MSCGEIGAAGLRTRLMVELRSDPPVSSEVKAAIVDQIVAGWEQAMSESEVMSATKRTTVVDDVKASILEDEAFLRRLWGVFMDMLPYTDPTGLAVPDDSAGASSIADHGVAYNRLNADGSEHGMTPSQHDPTPQECSACGKPLYGLLGICRCDVGSAERKRQGCVEVALGCGDVGAFRDVGKFVAGDGDFVVPPAPEITDEAIAAALEVLRARWWEKEPSEDLARAVLEAAMGVE